MWAIGFYRATQRSSKTSLKVVFLMAIGLHLEGKCSAGRMGAIAGIQATCCSELPVRR